jgi:hypothetical protein
MPVLLLRDPQQHRRNVEVRHGRGCRAPEREQRRTAGVAAKPKRGTRALSPPAGHQQATPFRSHETPVQGSDLHHARRLGLAFGKTLILDNMDELTLAFDLAIYTAPAGRSRAIDRYARSAQFAPGSDEAIMLGAMRNARFAVLLVQRRHPSAGLIVTDVFRNIELWLVDEGLEISLPVGTAFATRYYAPDRFVVTAGAGMPVDVELLTSAVESAPQLLRKSRAEAFEDRRLAEAVYRAAIADGIMAGIAYQDTAGGTDREIGGSRRR